MADYTTRHHRYMFLLTALHLIPSVFCSCISTSERNLYVNSDPGIHYLLD